MATAGNIQSNGGAFDPTGFDFSPAPFASNPILTVSGTNLVLSFTPVPEPTTVLAIAAVGLAGLRAVRRRRVVVG